MQFAPRTTPEEKVAVEEAESELAKFEAELNKQRDASGPVEPTAEYRMPEVAPTRKADQWGPHPLQQAQEGMMREEADVMGHLQSTIKEVVDKEINIIAKKPGLQKWSPKLQSEDQGQLMGPEATINLNKKNPLAKHGSHSKKN